MAKGGKRPGAGGGKASLWYKLDMPNKLELVEGWARDGATDAHMIDMLGVSTQTFYNWKGKYPEFVEALRKGKEVVDRKVENALLQRALGYRYDEVTQERQYNGDTEEYELIETKRVTKEVHPDTTAQIFWLKNRKPDTWRDRKVIDANLNHNGFDYLSNEELEAEIARLDKDE